MWKLLQLHICQWLECEFLFPGLFNFKVFLPNGGKFISFTAVLQDRGCSQRVLRSYFHQLFLLFYTARVLVLYQIRFPSSFISFSTDFLLQCWLHSSERHSNNSACPGNRDRTSQPGSVLPLVLTCLVRIQLLPLRLDVQYERWFLSEKSGHISRGSRKQTASIHTRRQNKIR